VRLGSKPLAVHLFGDEFCQHAQKADVALAQRRLGLVTHAAERPQHTAVIDSDRHTDIRADPAARRDWQPGSKGMGRRVGHDRVKATREHRPRSTCPPSGTPSPDRAPKDSPSPATHT
jgi:hypothetical protein